MPQSLSAIYVHLVFSTKQRQLYLRDLPTRSALHEYIGGICRNLECPPLCVGGVEDHVHILARLGRTIAPASWVKEVKRSSNQWLKQQGSAYADFQWQAGYAVFSVSQSNVPAVSQYIARQPEHHRSMSFQDELRTLLSKHQIEFDERYVWD
jgi:REP element-mobilizing transposase RayT